VQHLAVQIGERHDVVVDDADMADAGAGDPSPPAPSARTLAAFSFTCPGPPTPRSTICRE
jgi:hypothetical protein